ncbi:hypothetical protein [Alicyclobacillus sp. ALC3]|uniref:hypothetical protein n=1 Tax=Alicyclobacillus sp. ALC3 TaxID=2796143 RepID=UPI00237887EB|nr:hypothetical protein [Alicyclobacillus sp. ALC3]WDL96377.1 hypothetical protein JC200_18935 [Alicyclobacillus sp. ALC3]
MAKQTPKFTVHEANKPPADISERISNWMLEVARRAAKDGRPLPCDKRQDAANS